MGAKKLSSADKAAIVLLAVGEEAATEIFKQLAPEEVRRIATALSGLGRVDPKLVEEVVAEFQAHVLKGPPRVVGSPDAARRLIGRALGEHGLETALQALDFATPALVETLRGVDPPRLAEALHAEHPQTLALVLAHMSGKPAGELLQALPAAIRAEVVQRLARLGPVDPDTIHELEETLRAALAQRGRRGQTSVGGVDKTAALVASMDRAAGERLLDELEERSPELAQAVRERLFKFDDLTRLGDKAMQELLKHVPQDLLRVALRQAPGEVTAHFFKNMSERAAKMLKDDIAAAPKLRLADVEQAQALVAATARKLIDEGRIELADPNEVYV